MVRNFAKTLLSSGAHLLGIDVLASKTNASGHMPLIACYHRVTDDYERSARHSIAPMLVSRETFEQHLDWISSHYNIVSLDTLVAKMERGSEDCGSLAAITFDDGYADVYANAFPILKRKGIPAAMFVVSDLVSTSRLQAHDELYLLIAGAMEQWQTPCKTLIEYLDVIGINPDKDMLTSCGSDPFPVTRLVLEAANKAEIDSLLELLRGRVVVAREILNEFLSLDWERLREMEAANFTIGSHTRTHPLLPHELPGAVKEEVEGSLRLMQQHLNRPVRHFAYPNGSFSRLAVEAVAGAGYASAYTTCKHVDPDYPLLTIPRRVFWEKSCMNFLSRFSPAMMSCQANGIFDPADLCTENHFV